MPRRLGAAVVRDVSGAPPMTTSRAAGTSPQGVGEAGEQQVDPLVGLEVADVEDDGIGLPLREVSEPLGRPRDAPGRAG